MNNEQKQQPAQPGNQQAAEQAGTTPPPQQQSQQQPDNHADFDGLANKKPEELTPEELRLMADTMPGEGPGD